MRILMLQGPHGPFFSRVARALALAGAATVHKINFNGGDQLFSQSNAIAFRGTIQQWPDFLAQFILDHQIDCVMVFGDCRPIHQAARAVVLGAKLQFWAFEEGYVRPNFITFEPHGVNGYSRLPAEMQSYAAWQCVEMPKEQPVPSSFWQATGLAISYYFAAMMLRWRYPYYQHHRPIAIKDGLCWIRALGRKWLYHFSERNSLKDLQGHGGSSSYFLSVLQVATDAQVTQHSRFTSIGQHIEETVRSFAQGADKRCVLLIKHHPMDRGYTNYHRLICELANQFKLNGRVRYIHDQRLPKLMQHAEGLVTINSTVGLSAMDHSLPVKTLGLAVYDIPGLTSQRTLLDFWQHAKSDRPDPELHKKFLNYVIAHTQINGNFYRKLPGADVAGLNYRRHDSIHPSPMFAQFQREQNEPLMMQQTNAAVSSAKSI
jgi:capsular polysaccharide export protein